MIELLRIDDKLIHSQMMWGWVQSLKASRIIVANDEVAHDELRKHLLAAVVISADTARRPPDFRILSLEEAARELKCPESFQERTILVVSNPSDVVSLMEYGVPIRNVSVGWMSFLPGKKAIFETVSVDEKDIAAFRKLIGKGVSVKYQASPSDIQLNMADYLD